MFSEHFSEFWCSGLRSPVWNLVPRVLSRNSACALPPKIFLQNFSCCLCEPGQPFCTSALLNNLYAVSTFQLWLSGFSPANLQFIIQDIFSVLVVLPVWSWEPVSEAIYSAAILEFQASVFNMIIARVGVDVK